MALDKFRDPADPLWEQRVNQLEEGKGVGEVTGEKLAPATLGKRTVLSANGQLTAAAAEGTYFFIPNGGELTKATALAVEYSSALSMLWLAMPTYAIAGRTPKLQVSLSAVVNAKAAGSTFTAGLYQIEKSEGATGKNKITYKLITGSTAAIAAPVAETYNTKESATFAVPSETGYSLGIAVTTEAVKAESQVQFAAGLILTYT